MKELNNARISTFGGYAALYDIECVDAVQKIWKGKQIIDPNMRQELYPWIFFSRQYNPEVNELDQIYKELEIKSESIVGKPFWLVPKEKLLFGYLPEPKEGILLPTPRIQKRRIQI